MDNKEYIAGFEAGCNFIVTEIERYIKKVNSHDALVLVELLRRLKMEDKQQ